MVQKPDESGGLSGLLQDRVFHHFYTLCQIPHPSFGEKQLSDHLLQWAKALGLEARQDKRWNVVIKKPASTGYKAAPGIILQAHIDMVCEKAPEVSHNFAVDPIRLELDGDLLSTGGKTTLGADDGIGVAYAMAILEDKDAVHPPLEVLFTTAEEEDLSGALELNVSDLKGRLLINLDNGVERELLVGSCGGRGVEFTLELERADAPENCTAFELELSGLPGGHSGEDIRRGHGNAIQLMGRLLCALCRELSCSLAQISGGNFRLAIPREARAVVLVPAEEAERLRAIVNRTQMEFYQEYRVVAPVLAVAVSPAEAGGTVLTQKSLKRLLQAITLMPCGIYEMDNAVAGIVSASDNLGELRLDGEKAVLVCEIRAAHESARNYLYEKMEQLALLLDGQCRGFAEYPGWAYNPVSRLRPLAQEVYRREFGEELKALTVHCGLECGCFDAKLPGLDAISVGPNMWGLHSPTERLSVSSTQRMFRYLQALLKALKTLAE